VLVIVIFQRFGETHRGKPGLIERIVVAAAPVTVHAENHSNRPPSVDLFDRARQLPRWRIRIVDLAISGKEPHAMRRAGGGVCANNVVIQHSTYCVALLLCPLHKMRAAEQSLLFARDGGEQNCRAVCPAAVCSHLAKQARAFHAYGYARSIIVRAGSIEVRIHHVRRPRIKMPGNDEDRFRQLRISSGKNGVHVFQRNGLSGSPLGCRFELVHHDLQFAVRIFRNLIQSRRNHIPSASGAAFRVIPGRKRQPRSARHQFRNQRPHRFFIHRCAHHCSRGPRHHFRLRFARRLCRVA